MRDQTVKLVYAYAACSKFGVLCTELALAKNVMQLYVQSLIFGLHKKGGEMLYQPKSQIYVQVYEQVFRVGCRN